MVELYTLKGIQNIQVQCIQWAFAYKRRQEGSALSSSSIPSFSKPFVEICMKQHNKYEAKKYASRVGPEQKVKALLLIGCVS